jgi:hypothetical protein
VLHEALIGPAHEHFDFRYVFKAKGTGVLRLQGEEVTSAAWRDVGEIAHPVLRHRVAHVIEALSGSGTQH